MRAERPQLTPREENILTLAAEGLSNCEIAVRLGLSERTVRTHLERAFLRNGWHSKVTAVADFLKSAHSND